MTVIDHRLKKIQNLKSKIQNKKWNVNITNKK